MPAKYYVAVPSVYLGRPKMFWTVMILERKEGERNVGHPNHFWTTEICTQALRIPYLHLQFSPWMAGSFKKRWVLNRELCCLLKGVLEHSLLHERNNFAEWKIRSYVQFTIFLVVAFLGGRSYIV